MYKGYNIHLNTFTGKMTESLFLLAYRISLWRILEWLLWRKGPETKPGTLFSSKENSSWSSQKCGFEQGRQLWVGLHLIGHFPIFFPWSCSLALLLGASLLSAQDWEYLETSGKKILADNKLFNLLSFPVAIFCLKGGKKRKRERGQNERNVSLF